MDEQPDLPLDNFGAETEVATPPVASPPADEPQVPAVPDEQTAQPTKASGSEESKEVQPAETKDNPIAEEVKSGRPEKQDRLQSRFGELTSKVKERDSQIERLNAELARIQAMQGVKPLLPDENGEYSVQAIQKNQSEMAEAIATSKVQALEQRLERNDVAQRFDVEGNAIESKFKSDFEANPEHAEIIKELIDETIGLNINNLEALKQISPMKIAERYMKGVTSERRKAQSSAASNLETLQAEQAVTPNAPATPDEVDLETKLADIKF